MSLFAKNHKPGQGLGYKPPMESGLFLTLCLQSAAIIILAAVVFSNLHAIACHG
jgi:hypothetical protein